MQIPNVPFPSWTQAYTPKFQGRKVLKAEKNRKEKSCWKSDFSHFKGAYLQPVLCFA